MLGEGLFMSQELLLFIFVLETTLCPEKELSVLLVVVPVYLQTQ